MSKTTTTPNERPQQPTAATTDAALLELRLAGMTYRAIADYLRTCGTRLVASQVYAAVQRELARRHAVLVPVRRYELRPLPDVPATPAQALTISGLSVWVEGRPISVNTAYGTRRGGKGRYLKPEARTWRDFVWIAFRIQSHIFAPEQLPLRIHCTFYGVRGDADNYLKLTLDGIKRAIGIDDRHFTPVTAEVVRARNAGQQGARIEVWAAGTALAPDPAAAAKGAA